MWGFSPLSIVLGYESNFDKAGAYVYDQGSHYDYDSIMHYRSTSFTKDGSDTISVPEGVTTVIGQRDHLSDCDIERIQVHYGCKAKVSYAEYEILTLQCIIQNGRISLVFLAINMINAQYVFIVN